MSRLPMSLQHLLKPRFARVWPNQHEHQQAPCPGGQAADILLLEFRAKDLAHEVHVRHCRYTAGFLTEPKKRGEDSHTPSVKPCLLQAQPIRSRHTVIVQSGQNRETASFASSVVR